MKKHSARVAPLSACNSPVLTLTKVEGMRSVIKNASVSCSLVNAYVSVKLDDIGIFCAHSRDAS